MALQQNSDCLSAHLGNQFPFDGLFGDQADCPSGAAFRRFAADHGDNTLLLWAVENLLGSRPLFGVDGRIQTVVHVAMRDLADRLRRKGESLSDLRCGETVGKLAQ